MGEQETKPTVRRLPLWESLVQQMRTEGLAYGKEYPIEYFEAGLEHKRTDSLIGIEIHKVRRELEHEGFYLSGRGFKGNKFVLLPVANNQKVMRQFARKAVDALKRGVILGTNTPLHMLEGDERRRHEATLEKMGNRLALMSRS